MATQSIVLSIGPIHRILALLTFCLGFPAESEGQEPRVRALAYENKVANE
jgi:hypothetical protein